MIKYFWRLYYFFYTPNGSMQIGKSAYVTKWARVNGIKLVQLKTSSINMWEIQ